MRMIFTVLCLCIHAFAASAGTYNKVLTVGDAAPDWSGLVGTDAKKHALADVKDKAVVVLVFTCNSCPTANEYEERILALHKKHSDKAAVIAINANTIPDDSLPKMTARADKKKYAYSYLHDSTQAVAKAYGAMYTPEFFVLNKDRKVVYMGAMDDKTKAADATVNFVDGAVAAALAGKAAATTETLGRGCKIRYEMK